MPAPAYGAPDYVAALQALLPRGRAWPRDLDATITGALQGIAPIYADSNARANALLVDAFPATAYELLGEWESALGLPNLYGLPASTDDERRANVVAALTDTGGQSVAYFVALAATLGYTITIDVFKRFTVRSRVNFPIYGHVWCHTWRVNATATNQADLDVNSDVNAALKSWSNVALNGAFEKYKPAHTVVIIKYL